MHASEEIGCMCTPTCHLCVRWAVTCGESESRFGNRLLSASIEGGRTQTITACNAEPDLSCWAPSRSKCITATWRARRVSC